MSRKKTVKVDLAPTQHRGIISTPDDSSNEFEFVSDDPTTFKCIFNFFSVGKSKEIFVRCTKDNMTFFAESVSATSKSMIKFDCTKLVKYYCKIDNNAEYRVLKIKLDDVVRHFKSIDTSISSVEMYISSINPEGIDIYLFDETQGKKSKLFVQFGSFNDKPELFDTEEVVNYLVDNFNIRFDQGQKQFKKTVTDLCSNNERVILKKESNDPLQFECKSSILPYSIEYKDESRINLHTKLEDDKYSITLPTTYMKEFASTITTELTIFAGRYKGRNIVLYRTKTFDEESSSHTQPVEINSTMAEQETI
jgi:hypothetical protein